MSNPLLCVRCEKKSKRPGSDVCDGCSFYMRMNELKRREMARRKYLPPQRTKMAEIVVDAKIKAVKDKPAPRRAPFEVSFLSKSGIRMVERYDEASVALKRFYYLKDELNIAGLRFWGVTKSRRIEFGRHNGHNRL